MLADFATGEINSSWCLQKATDERRNNDAWRRGPRAVRKKWNQIQRRPTNTGHNLLFCLPVSNVNRPTWLTNPKFQQTCASR
jgi:hypothetical protein